MLPKKYVILNTLKIFLLHLRKKTSKMRQKTWKTLTKLNESVEN